MLGNGDFLEYGSPRISAAVAGSNGWRNGNAMSMTAMDSVRVMAIDGDAMAWKAQRRRDGNVRHNGDGRHNGNGRGVGVENGANWGDIIAEAV